MVEHTGATRGRARRGRRFAVPNARYNKTRSRVKLLEQANEAEAKAPAGAPPKVEPERVPKVKAEPLAEMPLDPSLLSVDFYCNFCNQALAVGGARIRCAECADYDLCVACSCKRNHTEPHELRHNYVPIGPNRFELFAEGRRAARAGWTADEELMLVEAISKFGFGNWKVGWAHAQQVAEMVNKVNNKFKTHAECEAHYFEVYIGGATPYPDVKALRTPIVGRGPRQKCSATREAVHAFFERAAAAHRSVEYPDADCSITPSEATGSHSSYIPAPVNLLHSDPIRLKFFQNLTGYNIYRDELDNEFNPDAEFMLKDLEFDPGDSPAEIDFKVRLVDLYNGFLDERIYRRRVLIHKFWNDFVTREAAMQGMTELEKMLYWRLAPLLRFQSEEDHVKLTKLLIAKIELEKRLEIVQLWSSLGLRSVAEVQEFDAAKTTLRGFASRHATAFTRVPAVAGRIVRDGVVHRSDLNEHVADVCDRFCSEFYINRPHLDDILAAVAAAAPPEPCADPAVTRVWDLSFDEVAFERNRLAPVVAKPPPALPEGCALRVVLDPARAAHDLSDIDLAALRLGPPKLCVQQSNVLAHREGLCYLARFVNERFRGAHRG